MAKTISNKDFIKLTNTWSKQLKEVNSKFVKVGLPLEKIGRKIYGDNQSVLDIGIKHEYGIGVPRRSFLKLPFLKKQKDIDKFILVLFKRVVEDRFDVTRALGLIGVNARNIVIDAFRTGGFGRWKKLSRKTIAEKQSTKILIDTGTLRNSITWIVK